METELKGSGIEQCQEYHFALERIDTVPVGVYLCNVHVFETVFI
jgi:hypothetical protein